MTPHIEPGILRTFLWFEWLRFGLVALTLWPRAGVTADSRVFAFLAAIEVTTLLVLLNWPRLPERWGRWFLPVTLGIATIGPLVEVAAATGMRVRLGIADDRALVHAVQVAFLLFVPLVLIAWQYRFRTVLVYSIGVVFVESVITVGAVQRAGGDPSLGPALLGFQVLLFLFVGGVIARLANDQRAARATLAKLAVEQEDIAIERERTRLARELHDTLAHGLAGVAVQLEAARANWDIDSEKARALVDGSLDATRSSLDEARRSIGALRAGPLEVHGLAGAIERRAADVQSESGVEIATNLTALGRVPTESEQTVFRVVDEALTNVGRHSEATSAVVQVLERNGRVRIQVTDDGKGFDPGAVDTTTHHGLVGMRERARLADAMVEVVSAPGKGTTVTFEVPT